MSTGPTEGFLRPPEPRRRASFRRDEDAAAPPQSGMRFTEAAAAGGTDLDVLMGYQIFLGRDPENSFVIADAKTSPVRAFLLALMSSGEFQSAVLDKLAAGRKLPHEDASPRPHPDQLDWLFRHILFEPLERQAMRESAFWRDMLTAVIATPGFPSPPLRAATAAQRPGIEAVVAAEGFVLIHVDQPKPDDPAQPGGSISGSGWAIAPADVAEVAVYLDDTLLTHASYGLPRPDVARNFPHYRHVDHCGFRFNAELPADFAPGQAGQLTITVRTARGDLGRKSVRLKLPYEPDGAAQQGVAQDFWPIRVFVEDVSVDSERQLRLRGWAASRAPLRGIAVSLGDEALGEAETGLARPDIAELHPAYPNAGSSGFVMLRQIGQGHDGGPGFVRVQVTDNAGHQRQAIVPVQLPAPPKPVHSDRASAGGIEYSCDVASLSDDGSLVVTGWAVADQGIARVEVTLDGVLAGAVETGGARRDVGQRFPDKADAELSGFTFRQQVELGADDGPDHVLALRFVALSGETRRIEMPVAAAAAKRPHAADLRLEIDRPILQGEAATNPVRGALTISGWAVARSGIETVTVSCDDLPLGRAYLGMRREDIAAAFPDYEGALRAGFALVLPPGSLPEGAHRIRVVAHAGADADAHSVERVFSIFVEPFDALPPGGDIRDTMPPAEAAFGLRLLERQRYQPEFCMLVRCPAAGESDLSRLAATLSSLDRQVYGRCHATIVLPNAAAAHRAEAALRGGLGALRRRVLFTTARQLAPLPASTDPRKPLFFSVLRAGDLLGCDALLELALASARDRGALFLYSDELRYDPAQARRQPFFKPEWSPELLLATNYVGRLWCAAAGLLERARRSPARLASAGDYDAVLRLTEAATRVAHVPRVLCARGEAGDGEVDEAAALKAALQRRNLAAEPKPGQVPGTWRIQHGAPHDCTVSVIMPTCGARGLVRTAIETIRAHARPAAKGGARIEIVIVDNTPVQDRKTRAWLRRNADIVVDMPGAFNWSRFNNKGAEAATGEILLFLNDDIEIREPGWLDAMLDYARLPSIGVVGARLLYPDGKVQHAGQYLADGHARHAFRFANGDQPGPFGLAVVARETVSVTGACLMVRRDVFDRLCGFEEAHSVVNNDLDFCLRSWQLGLSVVYTPHATLIHHELASRASLDDVYDAARFHSAWRQRFLEGDPFRNPRLGPDSDHYAPDPEPTALLHVGRQGPQAASIRRILAVKLDHIGDFLTALPALRSLKRRFPQARLDVLVPSASASLARQEASIDGIVEFNFFHARSAQGKRDLTSDEFAALRETLARNRYDMAIDLRMQPETRIALQYSGAPFLVGYDHDNAFPWLHASLEWEGDLRLAPKRHHISERLVQLVAAAEEACRDEAAPPDPKPLKPSQVGALAKLPSAFLARKLVCVHPGVGNVVRQWPASSYAALIDLLVAETGLHAILIGGADEASIAEEICSQVAARESVESLVGRVKLGELPEVMRACVLFVGNNSGPKHLAASLGVPTVGIHSGVVDAAEWAPLGRAATAIRRQMICSPCYLEFASDCPRSLACLTGLRPRDVLAACSRALLAQR